MMPPRISVSRATRWRRPSASLPTPCQPAASSRSRDSPFTAAGTSRASRSCAAALSEAGPTIATQTSSASIFTPSSASDGMSGAIALRGPVRPMALACRP